LHDKSPGKFSDWIPGGRQPDVTEIDTAGLSVIATEFVIQAIRLDL
jgi:hypothetical protein